MERWFALEMGSVRDSLVVTARPLGDLLLEDAPAVTTRGGTAHAFDKAALASLGLVLSPLERRRVRVPITFYVDHDLPEDAYVSDEPSLVALRALGELPESAQLRDGRGWLGHARARDIATRHPTLFQFAHH
jgi:uncharacterized protein (UPF0216 family)